MNLYNTGVRQHCVLDGDPGEGQSGPSQSLRMTQAQADFQGTEIWCKCCILHWMLEVSGFIEN